MSGKQSKKSTKKRSTKKTPTPPKDALSISALADKFDIQDRSTVRKRLKGIPPAFKAPRLTLYRLTQKNPAGQTVQELLESGDEDPKLTEAKARKMIAEARRSEHRLEVEQGNVLPIAEVRRYAFDFIKAMHQRFTRYTKEAKRRLKLSPEQVRTMETDFSLIFDDLKRDHPNIF